MTIEIMGCFVRGSFVKNDTGWKPMLPFLMTKTNIIDH